MKIKEVIEEGKNALSKNNIEDNVIIARELLAFGCNKAISGNSFRR